MPSANKETDESQMTSAHSAPKSAPPPASRNAMDRAAAWSRLHGRLPATLAVIVLLYTLGGFYLVPHLARSYIEKYVQQDLGRKILIQDLTFNPYTLTARVEHLALTEADGSPLVAFDHLLVNAELSTIFHRAVTLKEVRLEAPRVNVVLGKDGKLNLAQLAPPPKQPARAEAAKKSGGVPAVRIGLLQIIGGRANIEDRTRPEPFTAELSPIDFKLTDFRTAENFQNAYNFDATTEHGERLQWSGDFSVQPLGSTGQFSIAALRAETIAAYLQNALPFLLPSGQLDLQGSYSLALADRVQLDIKLPSIKVRDIALASRDAAGAPWITLPQLDIADTNVSLADRTVAIGAVNATGAKIEAWRNADGSLNLQQLFAGSAPADTASTEKADAPVASGSPSSTAATAPLSTTAQSSSSAQASTPVQQAPESAGASWTITVAKVALADGTVDLEDRSVSPTARFSLTPISVTAENYSSTAASSLKLTTDIGINGQGKLSTEGDLQLQPLQVNTKVSLTNFDLTAIQPYLNQMTAMTLNSGRVGTEGVLHYTAPPTATAAGPNGLPPTAPAGSKGSPPPAAATVGPSGSPAANAVAEVKGASANKPASVHLSRTLKPKKPAAASQSSAAPVLQYTGDIDVGDLATQDNFVKQDFIKWKALKISGLDYRMAPDKLSIKKIHALKAYGRVVIESDHTLNITRVLNPHGIPAAQSVKIDSKTGDGSKGVRSADPNPDSRAGDSSPSGGNDDDSGSGNSDNGDNRSNGTSAGASFTADAETKPSRVAKGRGRKPGVAAGGPVAAAATANKPVFPAQIDLIQIDDGSANFADLSIQPNFATGIQKLKGTIKGLSSAPASRAEVKLDGSIDKYAPVSITGRVNLLSAALFTDIAMSFRNIELTVFNPYSGKFAGYDISKGKLTTELHYKVQNRTLDAQHHILIDQLEFGAATNSKEAVSLPVKLAVALLKDRNGLIDLTVPVTGSMDDPKFKLGPIIWQVIKNTLVKIVTAPFALLGSLFGGGEELAFIDFAPGSATLAPEQAQKIDKLTKALTERPQLKLDIPLRTTAEADAKALAQTAFDQALAPLLQAKGGAAPTAQQRLKALTALYEKQFGSKPKYPDDLPGGPASRATSPSKEPGNTAPGTQPANSTVSSGGANKKDPTAARTKFLEDQLHAKFAADPAQLTALGQARAQAVQTALMSSSEVQADRVFLTDRGSDAKAKEGEARMELKLQ